MYPALETNICESMPPCVVYVSPLAFAATLKLSTELPVSTAAMA
jgi:hypothetical protein